MKLSYWEQKSWLSQIDYTIVGSGIVGLNTALKLKKKHPNAKLLILEKGVLPQGASTKNAGFASFGSISELLEDLKHHTEQEVIDLVQQRINGLQLLRDNLGDTTIDYLEYGGYELFTKEDTELYNTCKAKIDDINALLHPIFNADIFSVRDNNLGFKNIQEQLIYNAFEGQIDTGKMMQALLQKVNALGISILNLVEVEDFSETNNGVTVKTNQFEFTTKKLLITTNGFSSQLIKEDVKPARAQILITKPIENLPFKGTFHLDKGYYYFRNIGNRILFGGARHLDFKTEETFNFGQTEIIQNKLEDLLKTTILPNTPFEVEHRWSGIMGMGNKKTPIIKQISNNVFCGVRLSGIGIAIGSLVGKELAELSE